jgi:ligand-binding sensor domain-containing protein/serine phosphatase RsbU (regulator of sigma subunit)
MGKPTPIVLVCLVFFFGYKSEDSSIPQEKSSFSQTHYLDTGDGYSFNTFTNDSINALVNSKGEVVNTGSSFSFSPQFISSQFLAIEEVPLGEPSKTIRINTYGELNAVEDVTYFPYSYWPTTIIESEKSKVFKPKKSDALTSNLVETKPLRFKDNATHNIQLMDVDQGLSTSYIYGLVQDHDNNIWIGYWGGGISRYDGISICNYNKDLGLSGNTVMAIIEDTHHNIWIGTRDGGVSKFNGSSFTHFTTDNGLNSDVITCLMEDREGNIWIGTLDGGLTKYDGKNITNFTIKEGLAHNNVRNIIQDDNGLYWIATDNGVNTFDGYEFRSLNKRIGLVDNRVNCIFEDSKNRIWIGSKGGLSMFHEDSLYNYSLGNEKRIDIINSICEDDQGKIWLGTDGGGIAILNDQQIEYLTVENGLSSNVVLRMINDNSGNIWVGTFGAGISLIKSDKYRHYGIQDGLSTDFYRSIEKDQSGHLWLGTDGAGLTQFDGSTFKEYGQSSGVNENIIMAVDIDPLGNVWFSSYHGQLRELKNGIIKRYDLGSAENEIMDIYVDSKSRIWIGTQNEGAFILCGDSLFQFSENQGLPSNHVVNIFETNDGQIWISTANSGICKIEGSKCAIYSEKEGLSTNQIRSVVQDAEGRIWMGSRYGGINVLYKDSVKQFNLKNGLPSNTVQSINFYDNNIWGSSENGVFCILPGDQVISFTKEDGVKGLDHYEGSSCIDEEGKLWWGSGKSLTSLDLSRRAQSQKAPDLNIVNVEINGNFYDYHNFPDSLVEDIHFKESDGFYNIPNSLELPFNYNHLTIYFSGIDWSAAHDVEYSYRMKGLEENWSQLSKEPKAEYRNLPSGEFTFQVKATGKSGIWSDTVHYSFKVNPPWWQTITAYLIYVLFGLFTIYLFIRMRTAQLKKRQIELENEVHMATEEIRQQKEKIEISHQKTQRQKAIIETAHSEIKDSINYAKRIQTAILPSDKLFKASLPKSFVFYLPKDIVAGDFYWMESRENQTIFAAADCTGHGVPGAMVSVICNNGLNRAVREFGLSEPGQILDKTRELIISEFEKSEEEVKDGMDIALCSLENKTLKYAGAHNPLWIIQKAGEEVIEIKADKQPIGKYAEEKPFTTHQVDLQDGDTVYIFSDGFVDQFGGDKGKKFKAKNFKQFLLSIADQPIEKQKQSIQKAFEDWKGQLEQLDDVCVIGVRV